MPCVYVRVCTEAKSSNTDSIFGRALSGDVKGCTSEAPWGLARPRLVGPTWTDPWDTWRYSVRATPSRVQAAVMSC